MPSPHEYKPLYTVFKWPRDDKKWRYLLRLIRAYTENLSPSARVQFWITTRKKWFQKFPFRTLTIKEICQFQGNAQAAERHLKDEEFARVKWYIFLHMNSPHTLRMARGIPGGCYENGGYYGLGGTLRFPQFYSK